MYISVRHLNQGLGVDESIARFFVDRKVPEDNIFWKGRLLYIGRGNGFVSIPVYYDLLFRLGLSREILLAENHVRFMERVMHYAMLVEFNQLGFGAQLDVIIALLEGRMKNEGFFQELVGYLRQPILRQAGRLGMQIPALNRADVFLFVLCDLPLTEDQLDQAIRYWYSLHTTYLLMDDISDYKFDKQDKEESSIVELGDNRAGFEKAFDILQENCRSLKEINPVLGGHLEEMSTDLQDLIP